MNTDVQLKGRLLTKKAPITRSRHSREPSSLGFLIRVYLCLSVVPFNSGEPPIAANRLMRVSVVVKEAHPSAFKGDSLAGAACW